MKSLHDLFFPYRWWAWGLFATLWSIGLLYPQPERAIGVEDWDKNVLFLIGKLLHILAYAFFAVLTSWLEAPVRYRWLLMFFLMAHAGVTELLQERIVWLNRSGSLADVVRNYSGILLGCLVSWKRWCQESN